MRPRRLLFLVIVSAPGTLVPVPGAQAAERFELCTSDQGFPPYTRPDGKGSLQNLARDAAKDAGITLGNHGAPRARCIEELRSGYSAGGVGAYLASREAFLVYPGEAGQPDRRYRLGATDFVVYRRIGSTVRWDGKRFSSLGGSGAIGAQSGFSHAVRLRQMGVKVDESARSAEQLLAMLDAGRFEAAVVETSQATAALAAQPALKLEALPVRFEETDLYLMVSRQTWLQRRELVEALWASIRKRRESQEGR